MIPVRAKKKKLRNWENAISWITSSKSELPSINKSLQMFTFPAHAWLMMSSPGIISPGVKDLENEVKIWTTCSSAYTCAESEPDAKWVNMRLLEISPSRSSTSYTSVCVRGRTCEVVQMNFSHPPWQKWAELFGLTCEFNVSQVTACAKWYSKSPGCIC